MVQLSDIIPGNKKLPFLVVLSFLLLVLLPMELKGQEEFTPSRIQAERLFGDGDYTQAFKHFEALLKLYPSDPLYKYYAGACLVQRGDNSGKACALLEEATGAGNSLRPIPADGWYYLGRAYHLCGEYDKAINSYDIFSDSVRKKELKEYNIDELIAQCTEGRYTGEVELDQPTDSLTQGLDPVEEVIPIKEMFEEKEDPIPEIDMQPVKPAEEDKLSQEYDQLAAQALECQFKADSLSRLAGRYRQTVKSLSGQDREAISKKILELETLTFEYQAKADKNLALAAKYNRIRFDGEAPVSLSEEAVEDKEVSTYVSDEAADNKEFSTSASDSATAGKEAQDLVVQEPEPDPVLMLFGTDIKQPDKIPVNDTLPEGLFYRIQTAAFRNPIAPSHFKSLGPVYGLKAEGSDITFYSIGFFRKKEDADQSVVKVRAAGFKDAFVIAQFEGKRISFERAVVLEKEWHNVSLLDPAVVMKTKKPAEPVTLVFRVQVRSSKEELPEDEVETLRLVAGSRDFDILINDYEKYVYLIGKFLTFESAASYSDLLYRNGLKEARVAAYLGVKEIPVDKARELFDQNYNK